MTDKILYRIVIETQNGTYELPAVNLDKYRDQLQPVQFGNPCLQIINEELSVLSITWDRVDSVTAWPTGRLIGAPRPEVLWRSAA